ncbi:MAG: CoA transferase [Myxococcales bacterium]|nr:CoA transferase [Myxococcales bacterium]
MGPLEGLKIIEIAGIGPGPFCGMMLADMGAEVLRIERPQAVAAGNAAHAGGDTLARGRRSIGVDLKHAAGVETLLRLVEKADGLIEGFRPGVMERLGLGPDVCLERNPALVYGRMTGFGQDGPLAHAAGHDINYIALSGVLAHIGRRGQPPVPPLNVVGDFGGGGMFLAFGMVSALFERTRSGKGQVVDAAMVDGSATLLTVLFSIHQHGHWSEERGSNVIDSGSHYYDAYETRDGKYVSVGAIEPQFYAELLEKTGLAEEDLPAQSDRDAWPALKQRMVEVFRSKTRDEWCEIMEGSDVCFAPVLSMSEAPSHPHNVARKTFVSHDGKLQPAPAPRFSRTPGELGLPPPVPGQHTDEALVDWGLEAGEIAQLRDAKAIV